MNSGLMTGSDGHGRGFRRIVELLIYLVIVPTGMLLTIGILLLVIWRGQTWCSASWWSRWWAAW